jgi:hypothetical protein
MVPVAQRCEELGVDPLLVMIGMLSEPEYKFKAAEVLLKYLYCQRKAVEFDLKELPDEVFDQEAERRVHLKILKGELKASDVS